MVMGISGSFVYLSVNSLANGKFSLSVLQQDKKCDMTYDPPTGASKVLYQDDSQEFCRLEAQQEETKRKNHGVVECVSPVSLSSGLAAC
jgi:hypothetical protein